MEPGGGRVLPSSICDFVMLSCIISLSKGTVLVDILTEPAIHFVLTTTYIKYPIVNSLVTTIKGGSLNLM